MAELEADNLWEDEEAKEHLLDLKQHPGYRLVARRLRVAEVQQLRLSMDTGRNQAFEAGKFQGIVLARTLLELMISESKVKETGQFLVPDLDPDELHLHLFRAMNEWERLNNGPASHL